MENYLTSKKNLVVKIKKAFLSPSCIILFLLFGVVLTSSPALAADKTVCASGCDQTTIQDGIDDAFDDVPSGGTVTVTDSRTYDECITMKDGVNVTRSVGQTPTIDCTTSWTATVTFDGPIDCNLDGFNITHSSARGAGITLDGTVELVTTNISNCTIRNITNGAGIRMNGLVNCTITGNTIYDCGRAGIAVGDPSDPDDVQDGSSITIKENIIGDNTDPFTEQNVEAGIYLKGSGSVTVVIGGAGADSNTICHNGEAGIRLDTITSLTIDNNTINDNTRTGILLIDVGSASGDAIVQNNNINWNSKAGINIGGASYLTIGDNNTIDNNYAGVVFNMGDVVESPGSASSGPVTITGNDINTNTKAGIGIIDAITNTVTITDQNDIHANGTDDAGGIGIQNDCTLVITKNKIRDNVRGGIHTGTQAADPGGFSGTAGSAVLTIGQNKVYGNGGGGFGGGIDVRHADGSIYNNLVYENHRGGIRFGDWIDEIINNTVADNGNSTYDRGGGIIYDDISAGHAVDAIPAGDPPAALDIRNNICAYNEKAGIRACFDNTGLERDYNLVYFNNAETDDCGWYTSGGVSYVSDLQCANRQYGGCGADTPLPLAMEDPHDMIANPLFEDRDADDYRIQSTSPAVDAGDTSYGNDVSIPPGVGTLTIDMGAYGGPNGINWP